ncbi:MAG: argininosuccinate synthase domain-containing protein [Faecalibacterium prausnitzii]
MLDLKKDFVENYIFPTLQVRRKVRGRTCWAPASRVPASPKALADIAIKEGADAICHGCTGKGNDQVRFELAIKAFCPGYGHHRSVA